MFTIFKKNSSNKIKFITFVEILSIYLLCLLFSNSFVLATDTKESNQVEYLKRDISHLKDNLLLLSENHEFKSLVEAIYAKSEVLDEVDILKSLGLIMKFMQEESFTSTDEPLMFYCNFRMMKSFYEDLMGNGFKSLQISYEDAVKLSLDAFREMRDIIYPKFKEILNKFREKKKETLDSYGELYRSSVLLIEQKKDSLRKNEYDPNIAEALICVADGIYQITIGYRVLYEILSFDLSQSFDEFFFKKSNNKEDVFFGDQQCDSNDPLQYDIKYLMWCRMYKFILKSFTRDEIFNIVNENMGDEWIERFDALIDESRSVAHSFIDMGRQIRGERMINGRCRG